MNVAVSTQHFVPASLWPLETPNETPHGLGWLATVRSVTARSVTFLCDGEQEVAEMLLDAFVERCTPLRGEEKERLTPTRPSKASLAYRPSATVAQAVALTPTSSSTSYSATGTQCEYLWKGRWYRCVSLGLTDDGELLRLHNLDDGAEERLVFAELDDGELRPPQLSWSAAVVKRAEAKAATQHALADQWKRKSPLQRFAMPAHLKVLQSEEGVEPATPPVVGRTSQPKPHPRRKLLTEDAQPEQQSTPKPQPKSRPSLQPSRPPPLQAHDAAEEEVTPPAPRSSKADERLSEYELQRLANIERNQRALTALGLGDEPTLVPPKPPAPARATKRRLIEPLPTREQPKRSSRPEFSLDEARQALDTAEASLTGGGAKRRRMGWRSAAEEGEEGGEEDEEGEEGEEAAAEEGAGGEDGRERAYSHVQVLAQERAWVLPPLEGGAEHRKSCHVCTQCVASWRGDFSPPLGCRSCATIWCSRCLTNMYADLQEDESGMAVHNFIVRANADAAFECPMCRQRCACQLTRGGTSILRHKRAGWVGVTGNADPSCGRAQLWRLADDPQLAPLLEPAK